MGNLGQFERQPFKEEKRPSSTNKNRSKKGGYLGAIKKEQITSKGGKVKEMRRKTLPIG